MENVNMILDVEPVIIKTSSYGVADAKESLIRRTLADRFEGWDNSSPQLDNEDLEWLNMLPTGEEI
jgi:hypothetical protein